MSEKVYGCAVNLVTEDISYKILENDFWLFFENKEKAKEVVCNTEFGEKYEYPTRAILCDIYKNDDSIYITSSEFSKNEVYHFSY